MGTPKVICTRKWIVLISLSVVLFVLIAALSASNLDESGASWSVLGFMGPTFSYGIVLDLGSSGSRITMFSWDPDNPSSVVPAPAYSNDPWYIFNHDPLSDFAKHPERAGDSLVGILEEAVEKLRSVRATVEDTRVLVYGTEGLREMKREQANLIVENVKDLLATKYQFRIVDSDSDVRIINGTEEAYFNWLTLQQLTHTVINGHLHKAVKREADYKFIKWLRDENGKHINTLSLSTLDFGGASLEIALTLRPESRGNLFFDAPEEYLHTMHVSHSKKETKVFGYSYHGFGHNEAIQGMMDYVFEHGRKIKENLVENPCFLSGNRVRHSHGTGHHRGTGKWKECVKIIKSIQLDKSHPCAFEHCSFAGNFHPGIPKDALFIGENTFAAVVNFFDLPPTPNLKEIREEAVKYCMTPWTEVLDKFGDRYNEAMLANLCYQSLYSIELLSYGLGFDEKANNILYTKKLFGVQLSWGYGAMFDSLTRHPS